MKKEDKYSLAKWAIEHALKNGAQQASVSISDSRSSSIEVREQKIDKLEQAIQNNLTIRLFVDNKYSAHSTNRLKQQELARFIEEAIAGTRFLSEDEFRTLPDPELYYKGGGPELNVFDSRIDTIDPQKKIDLAFGVENEVFGKDERLISVTASYYDGMNGRVMVNSNGFEGDTASSYYGLYATVSVKGGDARPEAYWNENAIFFDRLKTEGIGAKALDRALKKIGQKKIASARMTMIVENVSAGRLLSPLIAALNGSAIQQKNSFLIDQLGQQVASEKLTLTDDPFIPGGRASRLFDGEGLASKKMAVFEKGVLKTYYIDTYYGKKLNMAPTTGGTSNLILETGDKNLEQLIASLDRGILVTGFNGGNSNGSTGDFSFGIDGFLIEKGQIVQPVSEMNITGNLKDLWMNLAETGNDFREDSSWRIPSLVFNQVDFSGI
ncbi:MAG TPA: TldD/PmbA family protein [Prolixibacteraceae bacterium]|nr:TldD/PmbA family protein [Prolixibacteraceae bacterium]